MQEQKCHDQWARCPPCLEVNVMGARRLLLTSWPAQAVARPGNFSSSSLTCKTDYCCTACSHPIRSRYDADADRGNGAEAQNGHAAAGPQSAPGAYSQHVPEGSQPEAGSSPDADQSKLVRRADHSRHISWDEAFLDTPAGNGILDSGSVCSRVLPSFTNLLGLIGQKQSVGMWKHHLAPDRAAAVLFTEAVC